VRCVSLRLGDGGETDVMNLAGRRVVGGHRRAMIGQFHGSVRGVMKGTRHVVGWRDFHQRDVAAFVEIHVAANRLLAEGRSEFRQWP